MLERIRFIKVNRNKKFDYAPRYYDERKEKLQAMADRYNNENKGEVTDDEAYRNKVKTRMQNSFSIQDEYKNKSRASNVRLLIILGILILICYYIFGTLDTFSSDIINIDQK
ncbi:hypothetical protein [Lishizhenia sp.]|uniref:hypothetical protein n=1 Tax=Lishizhenia sp. TaxID=2497594 RepID=UPI00299F0FCA|nr:hypothetical protein [Lishizhenia sp.]MDX1446053.1 hypothetical protein [Lishizhenia sp.]